MPIEGYKAITVSEDLYKELKERAEKEGLSLPKIIEDHMQKVSSINQLLWLDAPQGIAERIRVLTDLLRQAILDHRLQEEARKLRLEGTDPLGVIRPIEEINQWESEAKDLAVEIANLVVEKDKETFEEWKKRQEENDMKTFLSSSSRQTKNPIVNPATGMLESWAYKTNAEVIEEQLKDLCDKIEAIFSQKGSQLEILTKNIVEIGKLATQWSDLKKYVPYLSAEAQRLDQRISKRLGD